jgi:hypothetical protein
MLLQAACSKSSHHGGGGVGNVCCLWRVTYDFRSTRNLVAAAASLCSGHSDSIVYSAVASAAAANGEHAVDCYARLLHATALLNSGNLQAAEAQVSCTDDAALSLSAKSIAGLIV